MSLSITVSLIRWVRMADIRTIVFLHIVLCLGSCSELPDRECCDSAPPPPPHYHTVTPTSTTTTTQAPIYGMSPEQEPQTLNCLMAKQLCNEDSNCSAILKVIPTLCGPELVACSTVTVARCQAALRTLVVFPWFQPTCLCKEPRIDPQCNAFRDMLFDHPCVFVSRKEADMHPLKFIPTCEQAQEICRNNPWCKQRLESFRTTCRFRDGHCRNPNREECLKAWLQLRETPLLGCICPDENKKCSRLYSLVNENPCVEVDHNVSLEQLKHIAGTCQSALDDCASNPGCRGYLELLSRNCDTSRCHQAACRSSLQDIYKHLSETNNELALKIALCVCRGDDKYSQNECLRAQRKLHPPCAESSDSLSISQCHNLGRDCRSDRICRYRLEYYELSCAADTMTGRCAGQHKECMRAMMGLLGTDLHTNCVCKGDAFHNINHCLAWKRLLWGNPCVVESQLTYHLAQLGINADILLPERIIPTPESSKSKHASKNHKYSYSYNSQNNGIETGSVYKEEEKYPSSLPKDTHDDDDQIPYDLGYGANNDHGYPEADFMGYEEDGTKLQASKGASTPQSDHTVPHVAPALPSSTTTIITTTTMTTTTTTTTTIPTTTLPERYCKIKRPWDEKPHIIEEGSSKRLYREGEDDCSELCFCELNERTKCKVLECIENRPCETDYAVYNHNAPAYQATRGECICYSGDFVCMRPKEEEYELPTGLFLMLGFSRTEEALLRNVTNGGAIDAVINLEAIVRDISYEKKRDCHIELLNATVDNLILQVRNYQVSLGPGNDSYTLEKLHDERNRCEPVVQKVAEMINGRDSKIHNDVRLSVFVLAEVLDNIPSTQKISHGTPSPRVSLSGASWLWPWLFCCLTILSVRQFSCCGGLTPL